MQKRFQIGLGFGFGRLAFGFALLMVGPAPAWAGLCAFCGGNAATVGDGIVFDELKLEGAVNPEGPFITGVKSVTSSGPPAGIPVTLEVEGDKLLAFTKDGTRQSIPLPGIVISLAMRDGRAYDVRLDRPFDEMRFWAEPQDVVPAYIFTVTKIARRTHPRPSPRRPRQPYIDDDQPETHVPDDLCKATFPEPTVNASKEQMRAALVFTGDHYNADHTVTKQQRGTFNLACFGTASAKMHLLRHTTAGIAANGRMTTTLEQRTAMLRAITADYCSDGHAWTGDGTPLWWTDRRQAFPLTNQIGYVRGNVSFSRDIEAVWGPSGKLLCLSEPRRRPGRVNQRTCTAPAVSREMVTNGRVACRGGRRIPHCSDFPWNDRGGSPWSEPPLQPRGPGSGKTLPEAYVVTVNRDRDADYCNGDVPGAPISFP